MTTYNKIFVDSDTLLDFFLNRSPFIDYSETLLNMAEERLVKINTSSLILANVHYLLAKNLNKKIAVDAVKHIMFFTDVLSFEKVHLQAVIDSEHTDFEDSIQYQIAKQNHCDLIISRNIRHYKKFNMPVLTAEQFLRTIL